MVRDGLAPLALIIRITALRNFARCAGSFRLHRR
jgi:hypothetical protein